MDYPDNTDQGGAAEVRACVNFGNGGDEPRSNPVEIAARRRGRSGVRLSGIKMSKNEAPLSTSGAMRWKGRRKKEEMSVIGWLDEFRQ